MFQSLQRYKSLYSKARLVNRNSSSISNALNINNVDLQYHCFPSFSLMFIGTAASTPNKLRGSTSTILHLGSESFLFDAGEGTSRQILFGKNLNRRISRIFITHMHSDHLVGLPSILMNNHIKRNDDLEDDDDSEDNDNDNQPLMIYGPQGLHEYLGTFLKLTDATLTQEVIVHEFIISEDDVNRAFHNKPIPWHKPLNKFQFAPLDHRKFTPFLKRVEIRSNADGLWSVVDDPRVNVKAGLISHRIPSFGFIIKETDQVGSLDGSKCKALGMKNDSSHASLYKELKAGNDVVLENETIIKAKDVLGPAITGRKVVILGDTSDASILAPAAKDCDILVHESTYCNEYEEVSKLKGHSTAKMAALTALQFKAKRLILNHIGSIYLPNSTYPKTNENIARKATNKPTDMILYEEASDTLNRPNHVIVSRDFSVAKVPVGGYKMDNDEFYYLNQALPIPYQPAPKFHLDYLFSLSLKPIRKSTNHYSFNSNSNNNSNKMKNSYQNTNNSYQNNHKT